MNKKLCGKAKRFISGIVVTAMLVATIPTIPVTADNTTETYPYTLFAASSEEGAITVDAGNFCVNGSVATNGTIIANGNMNINGSKTEHANESMIFIFRRLNLSISQVIKLRKLRKIIR